jgi:hypothetical protein
MAKPNLENEIKFNIVVGRNIDDKRIAAYIKTEEDGGSVPVPDLYAAAIFAGAAKMVMSNAAICSCERCRAIFTMAEAAFFSSVAIRAIYAERDAERKAKQN